MMHSLKEIKLEWWERDDMGYKNSMLYFAGYSVDELIQKHGTPCYIYSIVRILENITRIQSKLSEVRVDHQLLYAMKANRHPEILSVIASETSCGVDACSPREVELAVSCGFDPGRISVTSTAVSDQDWQTYRKYPELIFNCDSISSIRRIAKNGYRSRIGIRINPSIGVGYGENPLLQYAGSKPTKFGIYANRLAEATELANKHNLKIVGLHMHAGSGFIQSGLAQYRLALECLSGLVSEFNDLEYLNIGGGLGVPLKSGDEQLNLDEWAATVMDVVGKHKLKIYIEPGDHIVKDSGILAVQVVETEQKSSTLFAFVNAGFNVHPEPAFYDLPCEPVPVKQPSAKSDSLTTIVGNINEALDVFNTNHSIKLVENDFIAFINAGAYGASMSSNHCLRSITKEIII